MNFKVNAPGCPCDCGAPPSGPCGCGATQIQIDVTNADDIITIQGVRFIGGPCDYLDFTGFSAIEGTYYVDWPYEGGEIELGRWAATNGPLTDALGTKYCVYAQLNLSVPSVPGGDACDGFLCLCIHVETLSSGSTCPDVEDITFTSCLLLNCGSFTEDNDVELAICVGDTQSVSQPTTDDVDCDIKYYDWTATWAPV